MWKYWPFFPKTWTKGHWPLDDLWPHVCWGHMCDSRLPKDHCVQVPWQYINVCGYSDQFCKIPHTYTYILHTTYYIQNEWSHSLLLNSVQARQLLNSVQARQKTTKQKHVQKERKKKETIWRWHTQDKTRDRTGLVGQYGYINAHTVHLLQMCYKILRSHEV